MRRLILRQNCSLDGCVAAKTLRPIRTEEA